ncbi:MAG: hypothetical protein AAF629_16815 [Chloroflexota bacterium]
MTQLPLNPYVGPRTFTEKDKYFFGRSQETRDLLALIAAEKLVLFYAQSGAGKSSMLRKSLSPGLRTRDFEVLPIARVSGELPTGIEADKVSNIFIFNLLVDLSRNLDLVSKAANELVNETLPDFLGPAETPSEKRRGTRIPFVLIIDQFEEIITNHPDRWRDRDGFFVQLQEAMDRHSNLWVVLTMREDYVTALDPYTRYLSTRLRTRFYMKRMGREAALEAIRNPAAESGVPFATGVAETLVENLSSVRPPGQTESQPTEFVEPVQLQVVCYRLWQNLQDRGEAVTQITVEDAAQLGDIDTALRQFYEDTLFKTVRETGEAENRLRDWFESYVITKEGTRGMIHRGDEITGNLPTKTVDFMAQQFVLRPVVRLGGTWYELVHDRFVQPIQESNQIWRLDQPLIPLAFEWDESGRDDQKLLDGRQLARMRETEWQTLGTLVSEFMSASEMAEQERQLEIQQRELEQAQALSQEKERRANERAEAQQRELEQATALAKEQEQRAQEQERARESLQKRSYWVIGAAIVAFVLAIAAIGLGVQTNASANAASTAQAVAQTNEAEAIANERAAHIQATAAFNAQEIAIAERATAQAASTAAVAQEQIAQQAVQLANTNQLIAQSALSFLNNDTELALALAIEAGRTQESAKTYSTIREALNRPGRNLRTFVGHFNEVNNAIWNVDEQRILTASRDRTVRVWDAESGKELLQLVGPVGFVSQAIWNSDGSRILTAGEDGTARVWDARTGAELLQLSTEFLDSVFQAIWNRDESRILTASEEETARVWDAESGKELLILARHSDYVFQAIWNGDESRILTASEDGTARVWDAESGQELLILAGHTNGVGQAIWNSDGSRILTASEDGTARVWDVETEQALITLAGHTAGVVEATWSDDESQILTASDDGTARVWDAETGQELVRLVGHTDRVLVANWSKDGNQVLTASADGTARVWDTSIGAELPIFTVSGNQFSAFSNFEFSADKSTLVVAGRQSSGLWDIAKGQQFITFPDEPSFSSVQWSPDQQFVLASSADGLVRVWNSVSGDELLTLDIGSKLSHVEWNPNSRSFLTVEDGVRVRVWDTETNRAVFDIDLTNRAFRQINNTSSPFWNSDGFEIMIVSDLVDGGEIQIFDIKTGRVVMQVDTPATQELTIVSWINSENEVAVVTVDVDANAPIFQRWDARGGELISDSRNTNLSGAPTRFWLDPLGELFVVDYGDTLSELRRISDNQILNTLPSSINTIFWGKDGKYVVVSYVTADNRVQHELYHLISEISIELDGVFNTIFEDELGQRILIAYEVQFIEMRNATDLTILTTLSSDAGIVNYAEWNSDLSQLLTTNVAGAAQVWDTNTGQLLYEFSGVNLATWTTDEMRIITVMNDGTVRQFYTEMAPLLEAACNRASRNLTTSEWTEFISPDETYDRTCKNLPPGSNNPPNCEERILQECWSEGTEPESPDCRAKVWSNCSTE